MRSLWTHLEITVDNRPQKMKFTAIYRSTATLPTSSWSCPILSTLDVGTPTPSDFRGKVTLLLTWTYFSFCHFAGCPSFEKLSCFLSFLSFILIIFILLHMVSSPLLTVSLHTICSLGLGGTRQIKEHNGYFCSVLGELKHSLHFCPTFPPGSLLGIGS